MKNRHNLNTVKVNVSKGHAGLVDLSITGYIQSIINITDILILQVLSQACM